MRHLSVSELAWGGFGSGVSKFELRSECGFKVVVSNYGASLLSVKAPDRLKKYEEVCLSFEDFEDFRRNKAYLGATVGRYANRIGGAQFMLDGECCTLAKNNGSNCLHGGLKGFDKKIWSAEVLEDSEMLDGRAGVRFSTSSDHGEEGFPGDVWCRVTFSIGKSLDLRVDYEAGTEGDRRTVINLTNHAYWNLSGNFRNSIQSHLLMLRFSRYLPLDENQIPTGEVKMVQDGPFDFRSAVKLGQRLEQIDGGGRPGLDHCFVREEAFESEVLPLLACLEEESSGRFLKFYGNQLAMQIYTNNWAPRIDSGMAPQAHCAHYSIALEAMSAFPNAVNVDAWKEQAILEPGKIYRHTNVLVFGARENFLPG